MKKIEGIQSWQIIQQQNGFADITFTFELNAPTTDADIEQYKKMRTVQFRVKEEDTDLPVTEWTDADSLCGYKGSCTIENMPAGGLYYIETRISFNPPYRWEKHLGVKIRHIGVGDLFLIIGQSNAAGWGQGVETDAAELGINALRRDNQWDLATNPLCNFHSPFMAFAKLLHKKLGYPIGLIPRAIGGSPVSTWVDGGMHLETVKSEAPILYPRIKAAIWYQGCTDAMVDTYSDYTEKYLNVINTIRGIFDDKLKFFTFQLNRYAGCENPEKMDVGFDKVREIQRCVPQLVDNLYVIPTIDVARMSDNIHNSKSSNMMLGERLAYYMLGEMYGKYAGNYKAPDIVDARVSGKELTLTFGNIHSYIETFGASAQKLPIRVRDDGGEVTYGSYEERRDRLVLFLDRELEGKAYVSGITGANPQYILIDYDTQLPVLCFSDFEIK